MGTSDRFDEPKDTTADAVGGKDKIKGGHHKAADAADKATDGKASGQIRKGAAAAKDEVDQWADPDR